MIPVVDDLVAVVAEGEDDVVEVAEVVVAVVAVVVVAVVEVEGVEGAEEVDGMIRDVETVYKDNWNS